MLALWRLSMRFLLRRGIWEKQIPVNASQWQWIFCVKMWAKWARVHFQSHKEKSTHLKWNLLVDMYLFWCLLSSLAGVYAMCVSWSVCECVWWVGGGGGQCSGWKLWTDRCSVLSAVYSRHSGSMGRFNTSTLYPHGTAELQSFLSLSPSSLLSLPFFPLSRQTNELFLSFHTHSFIQFLEVQLFYLWLYLVKTPVRKFFMVQQERVQ